MSSCNAFEVPRNEASIKVRHNASGPEGLRPGGTRITQQMGIFRRPQGNVELNFAGILG